MQYTLDIQESGDWLYDTRYMCFCVTCGKRYAGPKRSQSCWDHTSETFKEAWVASHQEPVNPPMAPEQMVYPLARFPESGHST